MCVLSPILRRAR